MTPEIAIVLSILIVAIILFITEGVPMDVVALMVLGSLALTGLVDVGEAFSGFSSPAVVTVWAILILSGGLARTGVASWIGRRMLRMAGKSETRLLLIIMGTAGILSGFMNSIGVASLFLPVVIDIARHTNRPPSKLLMPLAFAALLGGLTTLIGTPPNILISEALRNANYTPFGMFDYTPVGVAALITGIIFMVLIGRHLLPERDIARDSGSSKSVDLRSLYDLPENMVILQLPEESLLNGKSLIESRLGTALGINVIAVIRNTETHLAPAPSFCLSSGDKLLVEGHLEKFLELHDGDHLRLVDEQFSVERLVSTEVELSEVKLLVGSPLIGHTLRQVGFRHQYRVNVLALKRGEKVLRTNLENIALRAEDVLLVQGECTQLSELKGEADLQVTEPDSLKGYNLEERLMMIRVPKDSSLVGKTLIASRLGDAYGLGVLGIVRQGTTELMPDPEEPLQGGDLLLVKGKQEDLRTIKGLQNLEVERQSLPDFGELETDDTGLTETVLSPHTTLVGKTLREINFRAKYGLSVLAIWRGGRAFRTNLRDMALRFGDALLLYGPRQRLRLLGSEPDFLVLTEEAQEEPKIKKMPVAILIMVLVLVPVIFGWVSIAVSAVVGVVLMILSRCLSMEEAYRYIEWKAVFLIAGMLPLGIAMEKTGAARFLAEALLSLIGHLGPLAVTAGLFALAALASQVMPNPAVAVLLAPIALNAALDLNISPFPLMMAVAISASAAFLSPVGHSANVLVMGPGGYRFADYIKVGLPLTLVVLIVVTLITPVFWPF